MVSPNVSYGRMKNYLKTDQFVLVVDYEGNEAFFLVNRVEPMAMVSKIFAQPGNSLIGLAGAPANATQLVEFEYLQPARENRLYQIRPIIYAVGEQDGKLLDIEDYPSQVRMEWSHPTGTRRGGTATSESILMNGIAEIIGGVDGGSILPWMIPTRDDPSEVYDLWSLYGISPAFRIVNDSPFDLGNEVASPVGVTLGTFLDGVAPPVETPQNYIWRIGTIGYRYLLVDPTDELSEVKDWRQKLYNREVPYRTVTIGGIPQVSTRA